MANLGDFDASRIEPSQFEPLPPGQYRTQIVQSEMRPTKDGNGSYLWLELDILEGPFAGRKLWDRLNLNNPNAQAVEIAQRTLSSICYAVGKLKVADSSDLHLIPMDIRVRVQPPKDGYDASNTIRYVKAPPTAANIAAAVAETQAAQPPAATGNGGTPAQAPWKRA
jgi:hypothetical protein